MKIHSTKVIAIFGAMALALSTHILPEACYSLTLGSPGSIVPTGDMTVARFDHTATLLFNDQVLIVGGLERNGVPQPTAELFDPATGRFRSAGTPGVPRGWGATSVRLANGKVLIAGGSSGNCVSCYLSDAELYDPSTHTFSLTGSMHTSRAGAISILLPDSNVLIIGGSRFLKSDSAASAELYHPDLGTFSMVASMHIIDPAHVLLLKNGLVLVIGSSGTELYNPKTDCFTPTGKMTLPRTKFGAALLPNGMVLVAGGQTGGAWGERLASTQIYSPASGAFMPGPEMNIKRFKLAKAVASLEDGRILIGGGAERPEIYDPVSARFFPVPGSKLDGFFFSTATLLNNGEVLLAGGYQLPGGEGVNHAWLYRP